MLLAEISAAGWSAVAATASVISSVTLLGIHLRNQREAARPELLLEQWDTYYDAEQNRESIWATVRNVGRGLALHIRFNHGVVNGTCTECYSRRLSVLAPGESKKIEDLASVYYGRAPTDGILQSRFDIVIECSDTLGNEYRTAYGMSVVKPHTVVTGTLEAVSDRVHCSTRSTVPTYGWQMWLRRWQRKRQSRSGSKD